MSTPYYSIYTGAQVDAAVAAVRLAPPVYSGVWDLANGVEEGTVTGLALPFVPTMAQLTVEVPEDGMVIFAVLVKASLSAAGFDFVLSGSTDSINYRLHYTLTGEANSGSSNS